MVVLDPGVVRSLAPRQASILERLTPRQHEVLGLIAQGFNNAAIAQQLTLSGKSIEAYINAVYQELHISGEQDVHSRVRATLFYLEESQSLQ